MIYSPGGFTRALESSMWTSCKLGDICTIKTGKLNANASVENGEYPFFTCSRDDSRIDTYAFDGEALLIAGNGDVGFTKYYKGKFNAYQRTYVLMDFKVNAKYLFYYLQMYLPNRVKTEMSGSAVPYIRLATLSEMNVIIPDIETQKMIAELLSNYDALIENISSRVNSQTINLINQKQAIMDNIFRGV